MYIIIISLLYYNTIGINLFYYLPNSAWEIVICKCCGFKGSHRCCSSIKLFTEWDCPDFQAMVASKIYHYLFIDSYILCLMTPSTLK